MTDDLTFTFLRTMLDAQIEREGTVSSFMIRAGLLAEILEDAERWRAIMRCARIRMQGSAGFDPLTGVRREYRNDTGEFEASDEGWVHFGAEFWSIYPSYTETKSQEERDAENLYGRNALRCLADDVLLKERRAAEQSP